MKKLLALVFLFVTAQAFAVGSPMSGFYVGAGVGVGHNAFRGQRLFQQSLKVNPSFKIPSQTTTFAHASTGMMGDLFLGYGFHVKQNGYLGLELGMDFFPTSSSWHKSQPIGGQVAQLAGHSRINDDLNLSVLPGYYFNNQSTLVYGRLGMSYGQFKQTYTNDSRAVGSYYISDDVKGSVLGAVIGLGVDQMISNHFSLRLEGDFTHYKSLNKTVVPTVRVNGVTPGSPGDPNTNVNFASGWKIKANSFALKLSAVYTF